MDHKSIEQLLEKYFEGNTTLKEEASLREYFRRGEYIPPDLRPYQPLFQYFEDEQALQLSDDFEERLMEQHTAAPVRRLWPALARIAAAVLIALAIWWMYPLAESPPQQASIDWSKYEPETPEEAYRVTRMALLKLSGELKEGTQKAAREVEKIEKIGRYMK
jgi:hypothetical protein